MRAEWDETAQRMLDRRDRFTRPAIEAELNRLEGPALTERSIEFDKENGGFLTRVYHDRFSVIWYDTPGVPRVRAVVPTTRFRADDPDLKSRVKEIVQIELDHPIDLP